VTSDKWDNITLGNNAFSVSSEYGAYAFRLVRILEILSRFVSPNGKGHDPINTLEGELLHFSHLG